jgi:hypothetical protein
MIIMIKMYPPVNSKLRPKSQAHPLALEIQTNECPIVRFLQRSVHTSLRAMMHQLAAVEIDVRQEEIAGGEEEEH